MTANFLTFAIWIFPGFELQRIVAFRSARRFLVFGKYVAVQVISLAAGTTALFVAVEGLNIVPAFGYLLAVAANTLIIYFLLRAIVFKTSKFRLGRR